MKRSLLAWAAPMLVVTVSAAVSLAAPTFVVPRQDIAIPCPAPFGLGWTSPGEKYDCLGQTDTGYHILVSRGAKIGIGFLPFSDEWGHPTAESSTSHLSVPKNTIVTKAPARLAQGSVILKAGTPYPATASGKDEFRVAFAFRGFATTVTVHQAQVQPTASKQVRADGKEAADLLKLLDDAHKENVQLKDELQTAQALSRKLEAEKTAPVAPVLAPVEAPKVEPAPGVAAGQPPAKPPEPEEKLEPPAPVQPQPAAPPAAQQEVGPPPQAQVAKIVKHAAVGGNVQASSTHAGLEGEGTAAALIDGDLKSRWSSEYAEPQTVTVDLGKPQKLARLRLHWETASATSYRVTVSTDGVKWTPVRELDLKMPGPPHPWVDEIDMRNTPASQIRLELLRRINPEWGFSLYEIEPIAAE